MRCQRRSLLFLVATYIFAAVEASQAFSGGAADRVLLVRNGTSSVSMAIADDYARRRGVQHVLTIKCKDSSTLGDEVPNADPLFRILLGTRAETIDISAYRRDIEAPIQAYLASHHGIDFIVLTKGIPIRIEGDGQSGGIDRFSLDSHLAALGYDKLPQAIRVEFADSFYDRYWVEHFHKHFWANAWANRFWNSQEGFSHARFGGYLVTRLDGYTETDAEALTTRSLQAEQSRAGKGPEGPVLLDIAPEMGFASKARQPYNILSEPKSPEDKVRIVDEKSHLGDFNSDMEVAAELLMGRGISVELDRSGNFIGSRSGLMGYVSWGSNDAHFSDAAYHSLRFAPGAIAETAVSTSGRTFLATQGGQSLIADLISQGVTGVKGYVDEPLVKAVASPSIMFDRYTRGWTLAESFYAASALVGWEDVIVGDPLGRAYPLQRRVRQEGHALAH